jgi:hypothetical protein
VRPDEDYSFELAVLIRGLENFSQTFKGCVYLQIRRLIEINTDAAEIMGFD